MQTKKHGAGLDCGKGIAQISQSMRILRKLVSIVRQSARASFFGFVQGHAYLTPAELGQIKTLVGRDSLGTVREFENQFAALVGQGECISYSAGRMGFYAVMKLLNIGHGDEVILPGATCSVMVSAILRTGATPVFSDIDPNTFGSSPQHIRQCLTTKTRLIVAQHSFGIPCDIEPIVTMARAEEVFLLEDCALSLGSRVGGVAVGNFGDAALFSTDHSKPINTLTGGMIYTRDPALASKLRAMQSSYDSVPLRRQQALWRRLNIERVFCRPDRYRWMGFIDAICTAGQRLLGLREPYPQCDYSSSPVPDGPFPSKMPAFLACLGLHEIRRWESEVASRKRIFQELLAIAAPTAVSSSLPAAYRDERLDIVPLRFVWADVNGAAGRTRFESFVNTDWTWFMRPIVATAEPLRNFGYAPSTCPVSESLGPRMANLPCNIPQSGIAGFLRSFRESIK